MSIFEQELYVGEFRHNLDAKRRLTVPSKWRFAGDEQQIYLALPSPSGCVTVYPPRMVSQLRDKLAAISLGDKKGQRAVMRLMGAADSFTFDKSGRISINDRLFAYAEISKEVAMVGGGNSFNLWNPERYEAYMSVGEEEDGDYGDILTSLGL